MRLRVAEEWAVELADSEQRLDGTGSGGTLIWP